MNIGEKLKARRKELKLTLEDVAKYTNVARSTVQKWESGQINSMRQNKVTLLAECLNLPMSFFFSEGVVNSEENMEEYIEVLRSNPGMRTLFDTCKNATQEDLERAIAVIQALKK